jgi:branched-chain amino acid transport system substrate-binding protein
VSTSVGVVLKTAGFANSRSIISVFWWKDPTDPTWKNDTGYREWVACMDKYYPQGDKTNSSNGYAYTVSQTLVQVLKQCGGDLSRKNVMRQAANLSHLSLPMLLPGITVSTSATDFRPIKQMQMGRFNCERWVLFGPVLTA